MLLIDGHNLIGKLPNISLGDPDDEARLMRVLENYHATRPYEPILVVFDPARHGSGGFSDLRGQTQFVRAVFARRNENADDVIARIVQSAKNPRSIVVVTSDNAVQRAVRRHGAVVPNSTAARASAISSTITSRPRRSAFTARSSSSTTSRATGKCRPPSIS